MRLAQTLEVDQLEIPCLFGHQGPVRAGLDDAAAVEDVDDVCFLDRAQSVRDGDGGATSGGGVEGGLDDFLGLAVECGRGFVEEQDGGVAEEGAGDGDALFLSAREEGAFGADDCGEAFSVFGVLARATWSVLGGV